jgi:hypothetical protein
VTAMKIIGAFACIRGRRRRFDYCGIGSLIIYRPDISAEPIHVKHQNELAQYGGAQLFDRALVHEVPLEGDVVEVPVEVRLGHLRIDDYGEKGGDE